MPSLAFSNPEIIQNSKISILLGSFMAGTVGFLILDRKTVSKSISSVWTKQTPNTRSLSRP